MAGGIEGLILAPHRVHQMQQLTHAMAHGHHLALALAELAVVETSQGRVVLDPALAGHEQGFAR